MTSEQSWALTPREFSALEHHYKEHMQRWALERADHRNASFDTKGVPWTPEDFLGTGNRAERLTKHQIEKLEVSMANESLAAVDRGEVDDVPAWAKGK